MSDDISALREEVAALRAELGALQKSHRKLLDCLMDMPRDPKARWPAFLNLTADSIVVRSDQLQIPLSLQADDDGASITFMDQNLRARMTLSIGKEGGQIELFNAEGKRVFQLAESPKGGGQICVCDAESHPRVGMRVNEFGGLVSVVDTAGKAQVFLLGTPNGGEIHAMNAMHNGNVAIKATPRGGQVCVHEPSGQLMGFLFATTETGLLSVYGPHGEQAASLIGSEMGGKAMFHDLDGNVIFHWPE